MSSVYKTDQDSLETISLLKKAIELLNERFGINICLNQPGLEPLSIIGKTETEIIDELKKKIFLMFLEYSKQENIPLDDRTIKNLLGGLSRESIMTIAKRFAVLAPVIDYSNQDEEFDNLPFMDGVYGYIQEVLANICSNMLDGYLLEFKTLLQEFLSDSVPTKKAELLTIISRENKKSCSTISEARGADMDELLTMFLKGNKDGCSTMDDPRFDDLAVLTMMVYNSCDTMTEEPSVGSGKISPRV